MEKKKDFTVYHMILAFMAIPLLLYTLQYDSGSFKAPPEVILVFQSAWHGPDLSGTDEGTIVIRFSAVEKDISIGEFPPTKLQLFKSNKIEGLYMYYLCDKKQITVGLPELKSPELNLVDGNMHEIAYTYKVDERQVLYFDGLKVAEGDYNPSYKSVITGFAVKGWVDEEQINWIKPDVSSYSRVLSEEEIAAMGS